MPQPASKTQQTATIAGFMLMSVPFLAAGLAKGAMSISGQATSVLSPAQNAAEAAAAEQTTGNYSYGNTSFANSTSNMRQSNQWSDAPTFATGGISSSFRHDNGSFTTNNGDGFNVHDTSKAINNLPAGEPFVLPTNGIITVNVVIGHQPIPTDAAQARQGAVGAWRQQQFTKLISDQLKTMRDGAKITYQNGFAPPPAKKPGAPAAGAPAAVK